VNDHDRQALAHEHALISTDVSSVGMPLGMWAGRGDYATFSDAARDRAGRRALDELDAAITRLTEFRAKLAAAVEQPGQQPKQVVLLRLAQNDAYNLDAMLHAGYRQLRDDDMPDATAAALRVLDQVVDAITPIHRGDSAEPQPTLRLIAGVKEN
jgi:hypothetical protein